MKNPIWKYSGQVLINPPIETILQANSVTVWKWIKIEIKIKSRKSRRKGIPLKNGTPEALNLDSSSLQSFTDLAAASVVEGKKNASSASDSSQGNGDYQLNSSSSLKFLQQVLNNMSSPPAIPLYTRRYPTPNGYPQNTNGTETTELLDLRKLESHRRYVWAFHKIKSKARDYFLNITNTTCSRNKW